MSHRISASVILTIAMLALGSPVHTRAPGAGCEEPYRPDMGGDCRLTAERAGFVPFRVYGGASSGEMCLVGGTPIIGWVDRFMQTDAYSSEGFTSKGTSPHTPLRVRYPTGFVHI